MRLGCMGPWRGGLGGPGAIGTTDGLSGGPEEEGVGAVLAVDDGESAAGVVAEEVGIGGAWAMEFFLLLTAEEMEGFLPLLFAIEVVLLAGVG